MLELSPSDIGLHAYPEFRDIQLQALETALYDPRRFQVFAMPTGSGKSLFARTYSILANERTVFLTSTKGLQDQYLREFGTTGQMMKQLGAGGKLSANTFVDVRGKANYDCRDYPAHNCHEGQYLGCKHGITCPYTDAMTDAMHSKALVTNYAYWLNVNRSGRGLDPPSLTAVNNPRAARILVLDEAHLAPEELSKFLGVRVTEKELRECRLDGVPEDGLEAWRIWAAAKAKYLQMEIARAKSRLPFANANAKQHLLTNLKWWDSMQDRLSTISRMTGGDWVVEERAGQRGGARYWTFDPVWPGLYAEKTLFVGIPKVILLSATLRPKTMGLLGVPSSEFNFHEWPRVFPKYRSPVYHLPTVRMNYRTPDADKVKWLERIDQIIESRGPGRKGIIHTVSYDRQRYILEHSRYARWMVANTQDPNSDSAAEIVEKFKSSAAPSILVSPSMGTGWDFPGKECLWQIITKIPFPDSQSKVMKARAAKDQQYLSYLAMQDLVQQCGRGMRYEGDRCESFVVDDSVKWFMQMSKGLAPGWFIVSTIEKLPPLPPELPL